MAGVAIRHRPEPWIEEERRHYLPMMRPYRRCIVCREKLYCTTDSEDGDVCFVVDERTFCPDCARRYMVSHYPEYTEKQFRDEFEVWL